NLIVTNVPCPQFPLYVLGHKMVGLYPIAFLPTNHSLAVAIMSYDGEVNFGLLADYDAMPDVEEITQGISDSLAELVRLANKKGATPERKPPKVDAKKVVEKKAAKAKAPKAGKKTSKKKSPEVSAATPVAPAKPKAAKPRPVPTTSPVAEDGTHAPSLGLPSSGTPRIATGPAAEMRAARRARRTRSK
ncbi:MAG: WS/DGAT domain-containing protein, partial [Actinomycetes bacterium]